MFSQCQKSLVRVASALFAGFFVSSCVVDVSSSEQLLSKDGLTQPTSDERCFRIIGDFTHPDPPPPTDNRSEGILHDVAIDEPLQLDPFSIQIGLLSQYGAVLDSIDEGTLLTSAQLDLLNAAEVAIDSEDHVDDHQMMMALEELNTGLRMEIPCFEGAADRIHNY